MFYKHNYKKEKEEEKKEEEGFIKKLFQRVREISFYSYMLSFLIAVLLAICFSIYLGNQKDKKNSAIKKTQTVVQTQIVPKEQFVKKDEYLNETVKLNAKNFEIFISKKDENKGIFLIKPADIISKNQHIVLYKAVSTVEISGNPEILKNLEWSLSDNFKKINITPNSITIELNRKENTVFSFNLKNLELLGKYLSSNSPLLSVTYTESYAE